MNYWRNSSHRPSRRLKEATFGKEALEKKKSEGSGKRGGILIRAIKTELHFPEFGTIIFPSRTEAERAVELVLLWRGKRIWGLEFHPKFELVINGKRIGRYSADSRYFEQDETSGMLVPVIEEVKGGYKTPLYNLRVKVFKALYPNFIHREVRR